MNFGQAIELAKKRSDCGSANVDAIVQIVQATKDVPGDIVEAGCYQCGMTIAFAASAIEYDNKTGTYDGHVWLAPPRLVYAFSMFGEDPYENNPYHNFEEVSFDEIKEACSPFSNIKFVKGKHEDTVPKMEEPKQISILYMDSDFYSSHVVCLRTFLPRMSPGGYILFHDWAFTEVQQAIKEELEPHRDKFDYWDRLPGESQNIGLIRLSK